MGGPPPHERAGFANAHWEKQRDALEKRMSVIKNQSWMAQATSPQAARTLDLQLVWVEDSARLQLTSSLDAAHNELLHSIVDLHSAHAHPLLGLCDCHGPTAACCAAGHKAPRHCRAVRSSTHQWLLPLRCRWGTASSIDRCTA